MPVAAPRLVRFGEFALPTLVLHSRYDNAVPYEEGRRLAAAFPNARFIAEIEAFLQEA